MKQTEKLLCEALNTYLEDRSKLGLMDVGVPEVPNTTAKVKKVEDSSAQYMHEHINDLFAYEVIDLVHYDSIRMAFRKTHSYIFIDDPRFIPVLLSNLASMAVPAEESAAAEKACEKVRKEMGAKSNERDFGYHPRLDEIAATTRGE